MASDEEVEEQRNAVVELRARLEEARTGGDQTLRELDNDLQVAQLQAEEARLAAELAEVEARNSPAVQARGVAAPLGSAKEQMERALAQQNAIAEKTKADTRAAAPPAPTTPADTEAPVETAAEAQADAPKVTKRNGV